jgi:formylglycine-generating enzyme required for sulfatase activity
MNRSTLATAAAASLFVTTSAIAQPVTIDWSTVGNAGNAPDPLNSNDVPGIGVVAYEYRIGTYEVTNAQYAAFLNSVAASDPNGLYNALMGSDARGGITRSGTDGSYTYTTRPNMGDKPVNFVSWFDAARMCNWMTNGQGSGGTESGVYTLDGVDSISAITRDLSNPNQVFIPNEDEWYKAAYHQPTDQGGDTDDYWLYATQSNLVPTVASTTSIGDVANPGQDVVNYLRLDGNVTTVGSAGSTSFYGAFDMNGNVWEWNETLLGFFRGLRGGSFNTGESFLRSSFQGSTIPYFELDFYGFRLASPVPGPGSCNPADLAPPFAQLTFADISAFLTAFTAQDPTADLAAPTGDFTFADISAFLTAFNAGCP